MCATKGKVTHKQALQKAHSEYAKKKKKKKDELSQVEKHFIKSLDELENKL